MSKNKSNMCKCPYCGKLIDCELKQSITVENEDEDDLPILSNDIDKLSFDDFLNNNF